MKKSTCDDILTASIVLKKEPRSCQKLRTVVNGTLEQQQQNKLISQKERSRNEAASAFFFQRTIKKRKRLLVLDVEKLVLERWKMFFRARHSKKGKGKWDRSRNLMKRNNSADRQHAKKTGSPSGWWDRPLSFDNKKGHCSRDRECDYWHLPHCKCFKQGNCQL